MGKVGAIILVVVVGLLGFSIESWASKYVTDKIDIVLKSGPGKNYKTLGTLTSGTPVEVKKEQNGWYLITILEGEHKGLEGWIPKRHVVDEPPKIQDITQLTEENKSLRGKITQYESEISNLKNKISSLEKELEESYKRYKTLEDASLEYANLKNHHLSLQQDIEALKMEKKKLLDENQRIKNSEKIRWFLTGAGVLLCGWLIGMIMGRHQKKRSYISWRY